MKIARNVALTIICIILGVMLAWQYKSINYNQRLSSFQSKRTDELKDELIRLQNINNELSDRLQKLREDNRNLENDRIGNDKASKDLQKALEEARIFAGFVDVKGKGVIINLNNNGLVYVQERDILSVVNELRAAGAQAISINDERVVAMTEIREAGKYIMVNGKQMQAPFVIKAISDPSKLERSLTMIGGIVDKLRYEDFLEASVKTSNDIVIPKVRDDSTVLKIDTLTPIS